MGASASTPRERDDKTPTEDVLGSFFDSAGRRAVVESVWTDPDREELATNVRQILAHGLPATATNAGRLLDLSGTLARASRVDEISSRLGGLNRLLVDVITKLDVDPSLAPAAPILFGVEGSGTRGLTLTDRRERAAQRLGYNADYLRKHLESKIISAVAEGLRYDTLRYRNRTLYGGDERVSAEDSPGTISPDDLVRREELSARVWSAVYLLRAEFIAVGRARLNHDGWHDLHAAARNALYAFTLQLYLLNYYVEEYGERILRGSTEYHADYLIRIASWHPPFNANEAAYLRLALVKVGSDDKRAFLANLEKAEHGRALLERWESWMKQGWDKAYEANVD